MPCRYSRSRNLGIANGDVRGGASGITINGEPVAEADLRASHLSIMHGLLGRALPDLKDFYHFPGVPRTVIKAWITATLGKGSPVVRWAPRAAAQEPLVQHYEPRQVGGLICDRDPFMRHPAEAVAEAAGLGRLGLLGTPRRLLTHRLMAIEA